MILEELEKQKYDGLILEAILEDNILKFLELFYKYKVYIMVPAFDKGKKMN